MHQCWILYETKSGTSFRQEALLLYVIQYLHLTGLKTLIYIFICIHASIQSTFIHSFALLVVAIASSRFLFFLSSLLPTLLAPAEWLLFNIFPAVMESWTPLAYIEEMQSKKSKVDAIENDSSEIQPSLSIETSKSCALALQEDDQSMSPQLVYNPRKKKTDERIISDC